jgi:hypothetical protein
MKSMLREPITAIDGVGDMVVMFLQFFFACSNSFLVRSCSVVDFHVDNISWIPIMVYFFAFGDVLGAKGRGIWGRLDFGGFSKPSERLTHHVHIAVHFEVTFDLRDRYDSQKAVRVL